MTIMDKKRHWENVYSTKGYDQVSWYREHLDCSLQMIIDTGVDKDAAVIDVGGGSSTLVDDLLDNGFVDISVLDISPTAIEKSRDRLGTNSENVDWMVGDITEIELPESRFDVWHDRAVFHFLTEPEDRRKYVDVVRRSLKPGGHLIIAAFGPDGPEKCSGLSIVRYSPASMRAEFGSAFELANIFDEIHHTPFGTTQAFVYCHFLKAGN